MISRIWPVRGMKWRELICNCNCSVSFQCWFCQWTYFIPWCTAKMKTSGGGRKSNSGKIAVVEYVWYLLLILQNCYQLSLNSTLCITTRYLTHAFLVQEKSFVLCRRCCTAHSTQHVTTSSSRRTRQAWYATHCCVMCIKLLSP